MPLDQRLMSFKGIDRVSILTLQGRLLVPFVMGAYQRQRFTNSKGQSDLVCRKDGKWFLLVTVDLPDKRPTPQSDFLGVDMGTIQLATDSDGTQGNLPSTEVFAPRRFCPYFESQKWSLVVWFVERERRIGRRRLEK